ncbi:MAG: homoserine dehydrogenase [Pirellulaceae bacterium]
MCDRRLIVLKFGGSVLQRSGDVHRSAQEIYRWRRLGYQVVVVVSAIGNATDQLSEQVAAFGDDLDDCKVASLLATGERHSAALLGLALDRAGITAAVCDETCAGLLTSGHPLDSQPAGLDRDYLQRQLDHHGVVVLPGFIGRDENGQQALLGRGGSDLSALFIAGQLNADRCRLLKDVDGLYEFDPKLGSTPVRRFEQITWADALLLDESIVQHKGVRFARDRNICFEVAAMGASDCTCVGESEESCFAEEVDQPRRLRVALIGLGTVGWGVYWQLLNQYSDTFELVAVAVRNRTKALAAGVPESLLTTARKAVESECDVVVEVVGGVELPREWVAAALQQGKHVVTANKALLASEGEALHRLAGRAGVTLAHSAAVGGAVTMLESVAQASSDGVVSEVAGILNGSCNFILDQISQGRTWEDALTLASDRGLTEADPSRDLQGTDAAEKLVLLARSCGISLNIADIDSEPLTAEMIRSLPLSAGERLRQIARMQVHGPHVTARVAIERVPPESEFAAARGAQNLLQVTGGNGQQTVVRGTGAGRWPTTTAVLADLLDCCRRQRTRVRVRNGITNVEQPVAG